MADEAHRALEAIVMVAEAPVEPVLQVTALRKMSQTGRKAGHFS